MEGLELSGVSVLYGERTALEGIDLRVAPGEHVALIGPNGSGKTTLLRALAGILRPSSGEARPAGGLARAEVARRIAFLPQEEHWEFPFPVEEVVSCGRFAHAPGLFRDSVEDLAAVDTALAAAGVATLRRRPITELSGGERRRVMLARALAQRAPALLLDEPTSALDLEHRHALLAALRGFKGSVVLATHDLDAAAACASRVVVLAKGRIVADGAPAAIVTEALLKEVFRVDARVLRDGDRIHVVSG
ncbi:MAG TPA: ABC transporter ATP-binding protein [Planctomycetota bacterium]|nr:ABC transporter ATP-binding protein [Planctomycetota bacterium]